jgi:hypothetical protein
VHIRTTIRIDEALYRRAKSRAAETGRTVSAVIEDALREALRARPRAGAELPPLPTYGGSGTMPGVDLTSNAALRDLMDEGVGVDALR